MTHKIAQLLGEASDKVADEIERLEAATGHSGHDARLIGQNQQTVRAKITELGLDPDDTTPQELYHALLARYSRDAAQFQVDFKLEPDHESQVRIVELTANALRGHRQWALRQASAKALLQKLPPAKTRKALGYRSNDSMLKHADTTFVLTMARKFESPTWQNKLSKAVKSLPAAKHEMKPLKIIMTSEHGLTEILSAREAVALVVPLDEGFDPGQAIGQVLEIVTEAQKVLGDDLAADIAKLHASLRWWSQTLHLTAWLDKQPVSLNIFDIARDAKAETAFEDRSYAHAGNKILQKLFEGYEDLKNEFAPHEILHHEQLDPLPSMVEAEVADV